MNYKLDTSFKKAVSSKAFDAALAYEINCRAFYDRPYKSSLPIPKGQQMQDYAIKYNTTVEEMKKQELHVDAFLKSKNNQSK